jgi:D-alanine-D-alanine ligase-like ATP-grasp enzyme
MTPNNIFALLYQAAPSPPVAGICKPMKPGGYRDSGADIAFALRQRGLHVVTPRENPDPASDEGWSFPDTGEGIAEAVRLGATVLWANTVLFADHPVQHALYEGLSVVGQLPELMERFDDKDHTNRLLAEHGLPVPASLLVARQSREGVVGLDDLSEGELAKAGITLPAVVKPIRGRGSEGVRKVDSLAGMREAVAGLIEQTFDHEENRYSRYGDVVIVEEYLDGEECTVAVLPPGVYRVESRFGLKLQPWALCPVRRFGHQDGIAPYSGVVAVGRNSELLPPERLTDPGIIALLECCENAAALVNAAGPIRIDCRCDRAGHWRLFDLNLKPNMTGPGRPGRDDQESLVGIAARAIGWDYLDLVENLAHQHWRRSRE